MLCIPRGSLFTQVKTVTKIWCDHTVTHKYTVQSIDRHYQYKTVIIMFVIEFCTDIRSCPSGVYVVPIYCMFYCYFWLLLEWTKGNLVYLCFLVMCKAIVVDHRQSCQLLSCAFYLHRCGKQYCTVGSFAVLVSVVTVLFHIGNWYLYLNNCCGIIFVSSLACFFFTTLSV